MDVQRNLCHSIDFIVQHRLFFGVYSKLIVLVTSSFILATAYIWGSLYTAQNYANIMPNQVRVELGRKCSEELLSFRFLGHTPGFWTISYFWSNKCFVNYTFVRSAFFFYFISWLCRTYFLFPTIYLFLSHILSCFHRWRSLPRIQTILYFFVTSLQLNVSRENLILANK